MKKSTRVFVTALVALALVVPATTATAAECGTAAGLARLQIYDTPVGGYIAQGTALV